MTLYNFHYLMSLRRKNIIPCLSLMSCVNRKLFSYLSKSRTDEAHFTRKITSSKLHTSISLSNRNLLIKNIRTLNIIKKFIVNEAFLGETKTVKQYATTVQDSTGLSISHKKVQKYLSHLKETYLRASEHADSKNMKTARKLKPLMELISEMESLNSEMEELRELASDSSSGKEMQELAMADLEDTKNRLQSLEEDVLHALIPPEPLDFTDVTVEVNAGVGGQEAMLFCLEIFRMYQAYADFMGWESQVISYEETDLGGLRHGSLDVSGEGVYKLLKYEGGIHRVQRIPKTERSGRIHTSTVSVAVMPQPSEIDIQIASKDLKIETKRASGAGGQHVNTTDSAVRVTHIPTGIVMDSQKGRSQHQNKEDCMRKLRAHLYQQQLDESMSRYSSSRKLQVGTRARSEKIRTYNYPQDRITDHRVGVSMHNLPALLQGSEDLHTLICLTVKEAERESLLETINTFCDEYDSQKAT